MTTGARSTAMVRGAASGPPWPMVGLERTVTPGNTAVPPNITGTPARGVPVCPVGQAPGIPRRPTGPFACPARACYRRKRVYAQCTAVERGFGLEEHFIRGLKRMHLRCTLP